MVIKMAIRKNRYTTTKITADAKKIAEKIFKTTYRNNEKLIEELRKY